MPQGRRLLAVIATALPLLVPTAAGAATISSSTPSPLADDFADNGQCSLREMVAIANADNAAIENACTVTGTLGADTIQLGVGNYTLTTPIDGAPDIDDGDLVTIDGDGLTVLGVGAGSTTLDGGDFDRVFFVAAPLTLQNVTVINGTSDFNGGGIAAVDDVTLRDARVLENVADNGASGGGISINGAGNVLTLIDSTVNNNLATSTGGGVALFGGASVVASVDLATVTTIDGNTSTLQGGGINNSGTGDITLNSGVTVNNNHGGSVGGGLASNGDGDLMVNGAMVNGNDALASGQGGGIYYVAGGSHQLLLTDAKVQNNSVSGVTAVGAGVFAGIGAGTATISRSLISGNTMTIADDAANGVVHGAGGVSVSGSGQSTIRDSRLFGNTITVNDPQDFGVGAGINDVGTLTIERTTLDNNVVTGGSGRNGGALNVSQSAAGPAKVINSTFTGNSIGTTQPATTSGGAIFAPTAFAALTVAQSTFAGNTAPAGSSIGATGSSYTIRGSVFRDGAAACVPNTLTGVDGYNVDEGTSCVGATDDTDRENTGATLGSLAGNGGPTIGLIEPMQTMALTGPAEAFNLVPASSCLDLDGVTPLTVDQRGASRPAEGACEPGAYESQTTPPPGGGGGGTITTPPATATGQRAAALKKCKKKPKGPKRKKCLKKAKRLPL
jgi:hypothetical protein